MAQTTKARHWAFVFYPESAPPDWLEIVKLSGLKCAISPLHDRDAHSDPAVEDGKKPHYHSIASWDGPQTFSAASAFTQGKLNGTIPVKLESVRGYYRYFTHADDPDKFQYDPADILHLNGFDIREHYEMTRAERMKLMGEVQAYIRQHDIMEYADLLDALIDTGENDMWEVAATNTLVFRAYIASRRHLAGGRKEDADG